MRILLHRPIVAALLLAGLGVASGAALADERVRLMIINQATEAAHLTVEEAQCAEGSDVLEGRTVLIELPRAAAELRLLGQGACAASEARLRIVLTDLVGGTIGAVTLRRAPGVQAAEIAAEGVAAVGSCVQTRQERLGGRLVLTAWFRPCAR